MVLSSASISPRGYKSPQRLIFMYSSELRKYTKALSTNTFVSMLLKSIISNDSVYFLYLDLIENITTIR